LDDQLFISILNAFDDFHAFQNQQNLSNAKIFVTNLTNNSNNNILQSFYNYIINSYNDYYNSNNQIDIFYLSLNDFYFAITLIHQSSEFYEQPYELPRRQPYFENTNPTVENTEKRLDVLNFFFNIISKLYWFKNIKKIKNIYLILLGIITRLKNRIDYVITRSYFDEIYQNDQYNELFNDIENSIFGTYHSVGGKKKSKRKRKLSKKRKKKIIKKK
jgi:hypothetical protein